MKTVKLCGALGVERFKLTDAGLRVLRQVAKGDESTGAIGVSVRFRGRGKDCTLPTLRKLEAAGLVRVSLYYANAAVSLTEKGELVAEKLAGESA